MNANKQNPKTPITKSSQTKAVPVILTICICVVAAAWLWQNYKSAPAAQVATTSPAPEVAPPQEEPRSLEPAPVESPVVEQDPAQAQPSQQPSAKPKRPLHDPEARKALALVGRDPKAEEYWTKAIFDTELPDKEREDLMEDLNEVGFADLKKLTLSDLPLIESRLQIIERIRPDADPFMKKHLDEAYKDLSKMHSKIIGQ